MFFTGILAQVKEEEEDAGKKTTPQQLYEKQLQKQIAASSEKVAASAPSAAASSKGSVAAASARVTPEEDALQALSAELHSRLPKLKQTGADLASEELRLNSAKTTLQDKLADCQSWQKQVKDNVTTLSARLQLRENREEETFLEEFQQSRYDLQKMHQDLQNQMASEEEAERSLAKKKGDLLQDEEQYMQMHAQHASLHSELSAKKKPTR